MYAAVNRASSARTIRPVKSAFPAIAIVICIGAVLFFGVTTIVLSLIPIFLPQKSAVLNPTLARSNRVSLSLNTGLLYNSRRKRSDNVTSTELSSYIGCKIRNDSTGIFKTLIEPIMNKASSQFSASDSLEVSIGLADAASKKRSLRMKRKTQYIVIFVEFFVVYKTSCNSKCKDQEGGKLQKSLTTEIVPSNINLVNVPLVNDKGDYRGAIAYIPVIEVIYVSSISSSSSVASAQTTVQPITVRVADPTTATPATTITTTLPSVTTTTACVNVAGFYETGTGHTCQTYIDYGFCNGIQVIATSGINSAEAQANCCYCGKGRAQSTG